MEIIAILFVVGVFAFLVKMISIVYEVVDMNFNIDLLWPDEDIQPEQIEEQKATDALGPQWKRKIEELDGILTYQE